MVTMPSKRTQGAREGSNLGFEAKAPPTSVWARSTKLLKLGAGLAKKEIAGRLGFGGNAELERNQASEEAGNGPDSGMEGTTEASKESLRQNLRRLRVQVEQAKEIVATLGQLKGAAMKAGQLISMELRDVLPPEVIEVLSRLQDAGDRVSFAEIDAIITEELGEAVRANLEIVPEALASASIGQVHRATWNALPNQPLVLKVQFRGIADTIESDLGLLERIARIFLSVQLKDIDMSGVFAELKQVLIRETDYQIEAQSLVRYRALAAGVPGLIVPWHVPELSTKKVLALTFEEGIKLDELIKREPSTEIRFAVAHQLLELYFREFFEWGLVQTDANFANFLFRKSSDKSSGKSSHSRSGYDLVLLDFGAVRAYEDEFRTAYRQLILACFDDRRDEAIALAEKLGLIDARETAHLKSQLVDLIRLVLRVFRSDQQPFDFRNQAYVDEASVSVKAFYRGLKHSPPPPQLLFLHRKLGGIYAMGKALGAKVDLTRYWALVQGRTAEVSAAPEPRVSLAG
jgi:aarF domain-containing kinase